MDVSNLSSEQKDRVLAALLQSNPELVQTTLGQHVVATTTSTCTTTPGTRSSLDDESRATTTPTSRATTPTSKNNTNATTTATTTATTPTTDQPSHQEEQRSHSPPPPPSESTTSPCSQPPPNKRARRGARFTTTGTTHAGEAAATAADVTVASCDDYPLTHLPKQQLWEARFQQLSRYRQQHGHCRVPVNSGGDYPYLGRWVDNQRQAYRCYNEGKPSWLNEERIQQFESIDFVWSVRKEPCVPLETRLRQFRAYVDEHGDGNVPVRHTHTPTDSGGGCNCSAATRNWAPSVRNVVLLGCFHGSKSSAADVEAALLLSNNKTTTDVVVLAPQRCC